MIPRILHRTVPEHTTDEVEAWWGGACALHPDWAHVTHRDPLDPTEWPMTAPAWPHCTSGAQRAGLIRLEALIRHGGIYLDSDVELYRPLGSLRACRAFAAWEDRLCVPDAVLGAEPGHPALVDCLQAALGRLHAGAWASGPGVTTEILVGRDDVVLLGPDSFYPYHYLDKHRRWEDPPPGCDDPWCFGAHHWAHSWEGT